MTSASSRLTGLTRFGQVNLTTEDVRLLDVSFWTEVWRRTRLQAVLLNCGGIMSYHPTSIDGHPQAPGVEERDLFGELVGAAREMGIEVIGRLDVGVVDERFRDLHPEWMMTDAAGRSRSLNEVTGGTWGQPGGFRLENEMYYSCINTGLFTEYLPALLTEVAETYDVAGFFTNGFPTVALASPSLRLACHCDCCVTTWRDFSGSTHYPAADDVDDPLFRLFVRFLQETSLTRMRELTAHTRGLRTGLSFNTSAIPSLRGGLPWNEWIDEVEFVVCDNQDRSPDYSRTTPAHGLWEVGFSSEIIRSVAGQLPAGRIQSMSRMRGSGRHSSKNPAETRLQMSEALAHGEYPIWHAVSGRQHSRRWVEGVVEFDAWLADNHDALGGKRSLADVGIVWSQASGWLEDWGRAAPGPSFTDAVAGWYLLLSRTRTPAQLVRADGHGSLDGLRTLVLPSGLALDAGSVERIEKFCAAGGGVIITGTAGLLDEWGVPHPGDPIGALAGVTRRAPDPAAFDLVAYFRVGADAFVRELLPDLDVDEVVSAGNWFTPFESDGPTGLIWNEGENMIPTHAAGLPEPSGMPALAWRDLTNGRRAYLAVDLDSRYFVHRAVDHRGILGGLVRWTLGPQGPSVIVDGVGQVDVRSWWTEAGLAVAIVNLDNPGANDEAVEEFRPLGPIRVTIPGIRDGASVGSRRAGDVHARATSSGFVVEIPRIVDFELLSIETAGATR
jgi:hypothetical protein